MKKFKLCWTMMLAIMLSYGSYAQTTHLHPADTDGGAATVVTPADGDSYVDEGGAAGNYLNNNESSIQFCANPGQMVTISFTSFDVEASSVSSCFDNLTVSGDTGGGDGTYAGDANDAGAGLACTDATDAAGNPTLGPFTSAAGGCLTFAFDSDSSVPQSGWEAAIAVSDPPPPIDPCLLITAAPACNGQVNLPLDVECSGEVTVPMVIAGITECLYIYSVDLFYDAALTNPVPTSPYVDASEAGLNLYYRLTNDNSGLSCWGRVLVEDKIGPELLCPDFSVPCDGSTDPIIGASSATTTVNPNFAIPDGTGTFSFIPIEVNAAAGAVVSDINVSLDISHTWIGDLVIFIVPPSGVANALNLHNQNCGNTDNMDITYDDEGTDPFTLCSQFDDGLSAPIPLIFADGSPVLLSALDGELADGTWSLAIGDFAGLDAGTVNSITLDITTSAVMASDACGIASLTSEEYEVEGGCPEGYARKIYRTWTATDIAGLTATCLQTITVELADPADITLPRNYDDLDLAALLCDNKDACGTFGGWTSLPNGHPSPDGAPGCIGTGRPGGAALCGTIQSTYSDTRINICESGASNGCFKIIRHWTILDWCTSTITEHDQIIKVADKEGPVISDIVDVTISTDVWACEATWYAPVPWIDDNCSDFGPYSVTSSAGTVSYHSGLGRFVISGLPIGVHQVTYSVSDCCGNTTDLTIDLTVLDLVPPVAVCDVFHTVSLTIDGTAKVYAETFDDGSHDVCGDVYFKTIRMEDLLGTDHGSDANQSATECDILNGDDNPSVSKPGNQIYFDDYAKFCCEDIGADIMVVLRVFDVDPSPYVVPGTDGAINPNAMKQGGPLHGHYNDCMVEITVEDKLPPYIECPTDITITCDYWFDISDMSEFGKVVTNYADRDSIIIYDNDCDYEIHGGVLVRKSLGIDGIAGDNCGVVVTERYIDRRICGQGTISRIFTATDPDGRTASCTQRIRVIDCDPYYINDTDCFNRDLWDGVKWPCDYNASACGAETDPSVAGSPILYNEDNCSLVSVDYDDEQYTIQEDACFKIKRTWRIIDWCQFDENDSDNNSHYDASDDGYVAGKWTYVQYIKVLNSRDPEFDPCEDVTLCAYNDNCTGTVELPISVSDDCTPNEDLVIDYKIDFDNDGIWDRVGSNVSPYPYNNPNGLPVVYFSSLNPNADGTYALGTHRIQWNAEDHCGNVGTCTYLFTIEDCKEPTPYCDNGLTIPVMPATGQITVWANDFDEGAFDNCTSRNDLEWRISRNEIGPGASLPPASYTSVTLTCDDVANGQVNVNVFAIDEAGNWDYCTTFIIVQDQTGVCDGTAAASIAGAISTEDGEGVDEVTVDIDGTSMNDSEVTGTDGSFDFPSLPIGQNYTVTPERNDDALNGVSTFDLVLISKHILNIESLDSPYKMIAADVNNSGTITTLDMVSLRKVILFIDTEFQNNNSWRFVDADFVFQDVANPFSSSFPEVYSINNLSADQIADFVAIKTGDVNGSATPNSIAQASDRNKVGSLVFNVDDVQLAKGEEVTVEFKAEDFDAMLGYQFTLGFDTDAVEFVETSGLNVENFGLAMLSEGAITASWNSKEATSFENGDVVFGITFRATDNVNLSEVIEMNSRYTAAEAYNSSLELMDVAIEFNGKAVANFDLYQNQPNPFKDATVIGFNLPEASAATLTVYDVSGRVLKLVEGDFAKGYNQVSLNRSELSGSGILYYQLDTQNDSATKKMILID